MTTIVPEQTVHTPGYGSVTIPAVIYDAALPHPAGIFSGKEGGVSEDDVAALSDVSSGDNQG